jgi:hypothetical protein
MRSRRWILWVGSLVALGVAVCIGLYVLAITRGWPSPLLYESLAVVWVAVITFFGFVYGMHGQQQKLDDGSMRIAITASIVSTYLVVVGLVVFYKGPSELSAVTETMLGSFTALVALVVPFYFGSTAYVQAAKLKQGDQTDAEATSKVATQAAPAALARSAA